MTAEPQASEPLRHVMDHHRRELIEESAIDAAVAAERGYRTISRPSNTDDRPRAELKRLGLPTWSISEDRYFPGLLIPLYRPTGERISHQWKPRVPVPNRDGKPMKYASTKGRSAALDVHPRNRDRVADPTVPLWITEGVKKADALTSRGVCVIALSGVFNWRSTLGTLGDWEDVPLRGRDVTVCFDSDAKTNPNVLRAMIRLGRWLKSKGVKTVRYLITPQFVGGVAVKGADDFFVAGGSLDTLTAAATTAAPTVESVGDGFSDARLAETIADDVLSGSFCWAKGMGWLRWDGRRWALCSDVAVGEAVRQYSLDRHAEAAEALKAGDDSAQPLLDGWRTMLSASRERTVTSLARGIVEVDAAGFDQLGDLLNCPNGVVDLRTGEILPHDPAQMMTKIAGVPYNPDATHPDWTKALQALPADARDYMQIRYGQGVTGWTVDDDVLVICQGGGENGKSTINEAISQALGDLFILVPEKAIIGGGNEHETVFMPFMGARFAVLEETPEAGRLDTQKLKRVVGLEKITARLCGKDYVTFTATHSMFLSTNHTPSVEENDHGTWRRLKLLRFPYRFRKPHEAIEAPDDRYGDPGLRHRCKVDPKIWEAALAWLVDGAQKWYANGRQMPEPPATIESDTRKWRAEADLQLGFADETLVFDPDAHVIATELLAEFNSWLEGNGHRAWSAATFRKRLEGHTSLAPHRLVQKLVRASSTPGLSRPVIKTAPGWAGLASQPEPPGEVYRAWMGVRFARPDELRSEDEKALTSGVTGVTSPIGGTQISCVEEPPTEVVTPVTTSQRAVEEPGPTATGSATQGDRGGWAAALYDRE